MRMKITRLTPHVLLLAMVWVLSGFAPGNGTDPKDARNMPANFKTQTFTQTPMVMSSSTVIKFSDNMDSANDTTALKARGYKVYYRGSGPQGSTAAWFTPSGTPPFPSYNGPPTGYVASNFNSVTGTNNIDNWLVLPALDIAVNDTMSFWARSFPNSTYPDSIRVMYSSVGDSTPEAATWSELGRFKVGIGTAWEYKAFAAPAPGSTARFAIRYAVVNGGPTGTNSDYIGIDQITVTGPLAVCPITTSPTTVDGSTCGVGPVTLSATPGDPANYVVWLDPSATKIVGSGNSFITPPVNATTQYFAADADTTGSASHVGPTISIGTNAYPTGNFSNGLFFTALSSFRLDSVLLYTNGPVDGFIQVRDTAGGNLISSAPFSIPTADTIQVYVGLNFTPGNYFIGLGNFTGTGVLYRSTSGAVFPYTVPNVVSITGTDFTGQTRYYYLYDWVVTPMCFGPQVLATADYSPANNTLPFFEDFENGFPCNWSRTQDVSSTGWQMGDAATLSSTYWAIPGTNATNMIASNDDACNCDMSLDFLITPMFDFSSISPLANVTMTFEAFYDSSYGSMGFVKASLDSGATWTNIDTLAPDALWQTVMVDLTSFVGSQSVMFAFHHDDAGIWADGIAIDDVRIEQICNGDELTVQIITDIFGTETTWTLTDSLTGNVLASGGPYTDIQPYNVANATQTVTLCVPSGTVFEFQINDSWGDGLFDGTNTGTYAVYGPCGQTLVSGSGAFAYGGAPPLPNPSWDSIFFSVTPPVIDLGADITVCQGTASTLNAGLNNVTWSTGATTNSITLNNATAGTFTYYVSSDPGNCYATDTIVVTVNPLPTPAYTYSANLGAVTFTNTSTNAISYSWNFGDSNTSTATSPSHTYIANGTYTVVLSATNACGTTTSSQTVTIVGVGIEEIPGASVSLSPNPASNMLNIAISGLQGADVTLEISNMLGQQVYIENVKNMKEGYTSAIDVNNFEKGIYLVSIRTADHATTQKLIIE